MPRRRLVLSACIAGIAAACGRTDRVGESAGAGTSAALPESTSVSVSGEWPAELGSALVVPSDTENLAVVLYPTAPMTLDPKIGLALVGPGGDAVRIRVGVSGMDSAHCGDAPMLRLARSTPLVWSIGVTSAARPIRMDSLDALPSSDSVLYTTEVARLGSVMSAARTSRLAGLPFAITALHQLRLGDTTILAAQLVRRVSQEANPVEERTFIIAERSKGSPFVVAHGGRSEGTEETVAHFELLGALRGATAIYLVVTTDSPAGSTVEILERSGGTWRVRWTRSIAC